MNGPNGITLFLLLISETSDIGNAIKLDRNILKTPRDGVKTNPTKNISFISAPPNVSFFNILFPTIIIVYITLNNNIPDNMEKITSLNPKNINLYIIRTIEKNKVTSSGIIK